MANDKVVTKSVAELLAEIRDVLIGKLEVIQQVVAKPKGSKRTKGSETTNTTTFTTISKYEGAMQLAKILVSGTKAHYIQLIIDGKKEDADIDDYVVSDDFTLIDWFPYGDEYAASRSVEIQAKAETSGSVVKATIVGE